MNIQYCEGMYFKPDHIQPNTYVSCMCATKVYVCTCTYCTCCVCVSCEDYKSGSGYMVCVCARMCECVYVCVYVCVFVCVCVCVYVSARECMKCVIWTGLQDTTIHTPTVVPPACMRYETWLLSSCKELSWRLPPSWTAADLGRDGCRPGVGVTPCPPLGRDSCRPGVGVTPCPPLGRDSCRPGVEWPHAHL